MSRKSRGCDYERKLVHLLYSMGFTAVRVAGSGCMRYPSPDILASNGTRLIAFEVKSSQKSCVYIREDDVSDLLSFASSFGAESFFAFHLTNQGWFFKRAELGLSKLEEIGSLRQF
ncbi:MAG TPA: Holliday junction resolvase Hjc [Candidatus Nanoarchaeia archaeon]|nr:Holliday junction resolvase Hjc [Candidatus Nanoarchaeia archaeon]